METDKRESDIQTLKSGYTKWIRYFEVISILIYILLAIFTIFYVKDFIIENPWKSLFHIFSAWVLADFITGLLHWLFDTWGKYDWPVLGKLFVRPFLEHHITPNEITKHDWIETNGSNIFVGVCIVGGALLLSSSPSIISFSLFLSFWGCLTNQFHKWSHQAQVPKFVHVLQKIGIILSKENHNKHHRGEFTQHYCITNGVLNFFLDTIGFFRFMEWGIQKTTGLKPRDNDLL